MAFTYTTWQSNNGNVLDANSWSNGLPGATSVAIFDGTSQHPVTSGLDPGIGDVGIAQCHFKPSYSGKVGFAGSPLNVGLGSVEDPQGTLVYRSTGQAFINLKEALFGSVVCDVRGQPNRSRFNLTLGGMGTVTKGDIVHLALKAGSVRLLGDVNITGDVVVAGDTARLLMDPNLGGLTDPQFVFAIAGETENGRPTVADGTLLIGDRGTLTQVGIINATTRVIEIANGKFQYSPTSAPGTTPKFDLLGGVYDQSDEKFVAVWGTTIIGPDAFIIGGVIRGSGFFPPSLDLREEYPGAQE